MFRFTIRDVLWLTVVVAMGVSLSIERVSTRQLSAENQRLSAEKEMHRANAAELDMKLGRQLETIIKQGRELDRAKAIATR